MASLKAFVGGLFFDELTVTEARVVSPRFRRIELTGKSLREGSCGPGDKVQLVLPGVGSRTYTPFGFDAQQAQFEILVYLHGDHPGAAWGGAVAAGDRIRVFGPRRSLPFAAIDGPIVLVGDETSFAVSKALVEARSQSRAEIGLVYEVADSDEARSALDDLGLPACELVARSASKGHLAQLEQAVRLALTRFSASTLVLTGSAQSIQHLRAALKARPIPSVAQKVKAYWSAGKRGLD